MGATGCAKAVGTPTLQSFRAADCSPESSWAPGPVGFCSARAGVAQRAWRGGGAGEGEVLGKHDGGARCACGHGLGLRAGTPSRSAVELRCGGSGFNAVL